MSTLFSPLKLRGLTFRNRIFVSPMCQYSAAEDGLPNDWHLVHLGSRAVGGAALVIAEATAVHPDGRITPFDTGIWSDAHADAFGRITTFVKQQGACAGIQLAHAGRKASTDTPWNGGKPLASDRGGWTPVAPSPLPFAPGYPTPRELSSADVDQLVADFVAAARRSLAAGFDVIEIHMAHGYLLHEFLSPLSNHRADAYGGPFENRLALPLRIVREVRAAWPDHLPLFVRISATDWADGGWDLPQSVRAARAFKEAGADLIDCSTGGLVAGAQVPVSPGYQIPFAQAIRKEADIATGAVGLVTRPEQAEEIVSTGQADAVLIARELLRNPHWPLFAARTLGTDIPWPNQYARAKPH